MSFSAERTKYGAVLYLLYAQFYGDIISRTRGVSYFFAITLLKSVQRELNWFSGKDNAYQPTTHCHTKTFGY